LINDTGTMRSVPEWRWRSKDERGSLVVIPPAERDTIIEDFIPSPGSIDGLRVEHVLFGGARLGKARHAAPGLGGEKLARSWRSISLHP
jgi:hypothetical protein